MKRNFKFLKKNIDELKETNWISELVKAAIMFVISVVILFGIRKSSPGNYEGEKLQHYLQKEIINALDEDNVCITVSEIPYKGEYETLSESEVLVMYCEYTIPDTEEGRVIALFERKNINIWHELIGIKPPYSISFIRKKSVDEMPSEYFYYTGIDVRDIDSDGKNDIFISLQSNMATRISHVELLLSKIGNEWKIITPSMLIMNEIEKEAAEKGLKIYYDAYELVDPQNNIENDTVYGLSHDGVMYIAKNPLSGAIDICYEIAANDDTGSSSTNTHFVYAMMKLMKGKLEVDENWNGGNLLILDSTKEFLEVKDLYWGYERTENLKFYTKLRE